MISFFEFELVNILFLVFLEIEAELALLPAAEFLPEEHAVFQIHF
jgi:hypothetical protein